MAWHRSGNVSTAGGGGVGGSGSAFVWMATTRGGMLGLMIGGGDDADAGPSIITDMGDAKM